MVFLRETLRLLPVYFEESLGKSQVSVWKRQWGRVRVQRPASRDWLFREELAGFRVCLVLPEHGNRCSQGGLGMVGEPIAVVLVRI